MLDGNAYSVPMGKYRKILPAHAVQMAEDFFVETPEGRMEGHAGDYLCEGVQGERWPIQQDIFEMSYEPWEAKDD